MTMARTTAQPEESQAGRRTPSKSTLFHKKKHILTVLPKVLLLHVGTRTGLHNASFDYASSKE